MLLMHLRLLESILQAIATPENESGSQQKQKPQAAISSGFRAISNHNK
jgi:hypothetical protein